MVLLAWKDDPCRGHDDLTAFGGTKPQRTCLASCVVASTYIGHSARTSVGCTSPITHPTGFHRPATSRLSLRPRRPLGPLSLMPCRPRPRPTSPGPCRRSSPHAVNRHSPCKERPTPHQRCHASVTSATWVPPYSTYEPYVLRPARPMAPESTSVCHRPAQHLRLRHNPAAYLHLASVRTLCRRPSHPR